MFERWRERRRIARDPISPEWLEIVAKSVAQWKYLDDDERAQLLDDMRTLLVKKNWEAAQGFELTDEIRVTIAGQASLLVLGLDHDNPFRAVGAIIVHPSTVTLGGGRYGPIAGVISDEPETVLGLAELYGPIIIAWDEARRNARHPGRGHNVVYHEFAHKLDMLDGYVDGTPPLMSAEQVQRWREVCGSEFEALRAGQESILDGYGSENIGEFFAVATEVFFDRAVEFEESKPNLYGVLRDFYRQDPAARVRTGARADV